MSGFDLLGDPLPPPAPPRGKRGHTPNELDERVLPAPVPATQRETARRLPSLVRLGTSTWSFPGWAGLVYAVEAGGPALSAPLLSRRGLAAYAQHPLLRTVGIDRTFYAPISREEFARYAAQVPTSFSFLCKAPNSVTSPYLQGGAGYTAQRNPTFLDVDLALRSFIEPAAAGLGVKAGPLVFQFSPLGREATHTPDLMIERLLNFMREVRRGAGRALQLAVEVRNRQLLTPAFADGLAALEVRYCVGIHPRMPSAAEQLAVMAAAVQGGLVVRWSLNPHTGQDYEGAKEQYFPFNALVDIDPETRATLAAAAVVAVKRGETVHMVANNKAEGSAPLTMFALAQRIVEQLSAEEIVL